MQKLREIANWQVGLVIAVFFAGAAFLPYAAQAEEALGWQALAGVYAPELVISPDEGAPGSTFTVVASNYPPHSQATVYINGVTAGRIQLDGSGSSTFLIRTPPQNRAAGVYDVTAEVDLNASATTSFTVTVNAPVLDPPDDFEGPVLRIRLSGGGRG